MSAAYQPPSDPVQRLYYASESLLHLAQSLAEEEGGVAHLMNFIRTEVQACAEIFDKPDSDT